MNASHGFGFSPYLDDSSTGTRSKPELCLFTFFGRDDLEATLVNFLPEQGSIEVQPGGATSNQLFELAEVRAIRFVQPVNLMVSQLGLQKRGIEVPRIGSKAPYTVEFRDGRVFTGELFGYGATPGGIGIYLVDDEQLPVRCFFPASGVKSFIVGEPLGKLLLEQRELTEAGLQAALQAQRKLRSQKLGEILVEKRIVDSGELEEAIKRQAAIPVRRLGDLLVEMGVVTEAQLAEALEEQKRRRDKPLGEILVEMKLLDKETMRVVLAQKLGIPHLDLNKFTIDEEAFKSVPLTFLFRHRVIPLYRSGDNLVVAMENPLDSQTIEALRFSSQLRIIPVLATREDIDKVFQRRPGEDVVLWGTEKEGDVVKKSAAIGGAVDPLAFDSKAAYADDLASQLTLEASPGAAQAELSEAVVKESDTTLVKLVNKIIVDAAQAGVSDIHIEPRPGKENVRIRFRRDGALYDYLEVPSAFRGALIGRIKIMASLDISERRKPQDGKIDFKRFGPAQVELRVATIPTNNNLECVVMRILASAKPMPLNKLRLAPYVLEHLRALVEKPYGLVLVCGPTGSGKTTTLHSLISHINTIERKIWTAEDPVEITQAGLNQVQMNPKIGWDFATALRAFLRADPDVIMVGEMRDRETAQIGVEASLTGHLVLSTLHTNSAPESVTRLLDMGLDPFNFADALLGVLAQRLARQLCPECRSTEPAEDVVIARLADEYCLGSELEPEGILEGWRKTYGASARIALAGPRGCKQCSDTGYRGRIALHELLVGTGKVRHLMRKREPVSEIQRVAINEGMRTLKQDGIEKVLQGHTTIEQVRAVCT
jgi:type II secretory ATPase GspE/PulE/Tfp pilus assembly ATPase PilB-like protein